MSTIHREVIGFIKANPSVQVNVVCERFKDQEAVHIPTVLDHLIRERQIVSITIRIPGLDSDQYRTYYFPYGTSICL